MGRTSESIAIARTACNEDLTGQTAKLDQRELMTASVFDGDVRASGAHDIPDRVGGLYSTVRHRELPSYLYLTARRCQQAT
jgi:hypothetical protein